MEYGVGIPSGDPRTGNLVFAERQHRGYDADLHLECSDRLDVVSIIGKWKPDLVHICGCTL